MFKDVLKQLKISPAEKEKVNIALAAATAGAKSSEYETPSEDKTGRRKLFGKMGGFSQSRFWESLSKLSLLLFVTVSLIGLSQIFNFPILRITKGGNEISPEDIEVCLSNYHLTRHFNVRVIFTK